MSKIVCDVCGTSFSDTAVQCPICGCVPSEDARIMVGTIIANAPEGEKEPYTYIKGGRFSKANVKKRSSGKAVKTKEVKEPKVAKEPKAAKEPAAPKEPKVKEKKEKTTDKHKLFPNLTENRGLVIAILAMLLAIVAVTVYIAFRFFIPIGEGSGNKPTYSDTTQQNQNAQNQENETEEEQITEDEQVTENQQEENVDENQQEEIEETPVVCTDIQLSTVVVKFEEAGQTKQIDVTVFPAETEETVSFESDNTGVASVNIDGVITAVAEGNATITVSCGSVSKTVSVECAFKKEVVLPSPNTHGRELLQTGGFRFNLSSGAIDEFSLTPGSAHTLRLTRDGLSTNVITKIEPAETTHYTIDGNTITAKTGITETKTFYLKVFYGEGEDEYITCKMLVFRG